MERPSGLIGSLLKTLLGLAIEVSCLPLQAGVAVTAAGVRGGHAALAALPAAEGGRRREEEERRCRQEQSAG